MKRTDLLLTIESALFGRRNFGNGAYAILQYILNKTYLENRRFEPAVLKVGLVCYS